MQILKRFKNSKGKHRCARCRKKDKPLFSVSGASARLCKECATHVIAECG